MTTTPGNASTNLPCKPPVDDLATWQAARRKWSQDDRFRPLWWKWEWRESGSSAARWR
jgi:hypothetical protein